MKHTKIEWCDATWNPVSGCKNGCPYCYAKRIAERFGTRISTEDDGDIHWILAKDPLNPYPYKFDPTVYTYRMDEPKNTVKRKNIFVCSMGDLFGEWFPNDVIQKVFDACYEAPQHNYLFLTKNGKRYQELADRNIISGYPANFWFGVSVTRADDPWFYDFEGFNQYVSIEPILGDLDFKNKDKIIERSIGRIGWIIIGAETGNRKEKVIPRKEWIDDIVWVADHAGIPVFMKDSLTPIMGDEMRRCFTGPLE